MARAGGDALALLAGFPTAVVGDISWTQVVVRLPEFLRRTGLAYLDDPFADQ